MMALVAFGTLLDTGDWPVNFGNPEVRNSGPECCLVSDNWRLAGPVRKVEFKLLHLKAEVGIRDYLRKNMPRGRSPFLL
jgi:hypothetical protein